jgi:hypothetical protein
MGKEIFGWKDNQDIWYYKIGVLLGTLFYMQRNIKAWRLNLFMVLYYYKIFIGGNRWNLKI